MTFTVYRCPNNAKLTGQTPHLGCPMVDTPKQTKELQHVAADCYDMYGGSHALIDYGCVGGGPHDGECALDTSTHIQVGSASYK